MKRLLAVLLLSFMIACFAVPIALMEDLPIEITPFYDYTDTIAAIF